MGAYSRLHVPIVLGSLRDRWCIVLKPPNFAGAAAAPMPSLETTLKTLLPSGRAFEKLIDTHTDTVYTYIFIYIYTYIII